MRGPAGAFLLVAIQTIAGTFILMWLTMLIYRFINRGYFRSTTWVLWPLMAAVSLLLPSDLKWVGLAVAGGYLLYLLAVYSQRPLLEWVTGGLGSAASVWLLIASGDRVCAGCALGVVHAVAGLLMMGAVTHGMILGHWYLNQARLPIDPLRHATWLLFAALTISGAVGFATRSTLVRAAVPSGIIRFAGSSYWAAWLLLLVATFALGIMIRSTVQSRSTQSATGLLYIAIVTGLGAQFLLDLLAASL